ncbi:hypothetical protein HUU53_03080 [Candidatus Micrarchaeota archaeon]|nr:hypothetical protein [Candidatus Micrarchaeota archaeon]
MHDLNCFVPDKAIDLGIVATRVPTIELKSQKDLNRLQDVGVASLSGSEELLCKACLKKEFFLINPLQTPGFFKSDALVRSVADNDRVFELPLRPLLHASFVYRAKALRELRLFLKKCLKLKAKFVFTSRAESEFDLKTEREIIAILIQLGLTSQQASFVLNTQAKRVFEEFLK